MSEKVQQPKFTITETSVEDIEATLQMHYQSWLDTYVNEKLGVTEDWVKDRFKDKLSDEGIARRKEKLLAQKDDPNSASFVAKNEDGEVIGLATPRIDEEGRQRVGSLYVDKNYHGQGVGKALMHKILDWADPSQPLYLEVASYNERAKSFYKKWGFVEIADSEKFFDGKIPEIMMIRKGSNDEV